MLSKIVLDILNSVMSCLGYGIGISIVLTFGVIVVAGCLVVSRYALSSILGSFDLLRKRAKELQETKQ